MRVSPAEYQRLPLRAHGFLADVPLHDVWAFHLRGGGTGRTLRDFLELLWANDITRTNALVAGLFRLRRTLGRVFGWDADRHDDPRASYMRRLTAADVTRSREEPGSGQGPFRLLYHFENESLSELRNGTVHAFSAMAMTPSTDGYTVYWAIYVKRTSWRTPLYMAAIDPFRRRAVYPAVIRRLEATWSDAAGGAEASIAPADT